MSDPTDLQGLAGRVIAGKYRLVVPIGQGGMGAVWRAEHLELGAPVAIKLVDARLLAGADVPTEEVLGRFLREARAAATLRSPHVVQILDYGLDEGAPYMVLELLEGVTLGARLEERGRLAPAELLRVVTHVARALSRAHEAGIVHRDLKPSNIFLVKNEDEEIAKVLDFGLAKRVQAPLTDSSSDLTFRGRIVGTPPYMSPEQAKGERIDLRADLWALGVIAFECACGRMPFSAKALGGLVLEICSMPAPRPSSVADVPAGFDAWFLHAVEKAPDARFASAREMADALRIALEAGVSAPAGRRRGPMTRRARWLGAAVAVALGGAGAAAFLGRGDEPTPPAGSPPPRASIAAGSAPPSLSASAPDGDSTCPAATVLVAGGTFAMGSADPAYAVARPVHKVGLDSFCLDAFEVTAGQYGACVERGACAVPNAKPSYPNARGVSGEEHERAQAAYAALCTFGKPELALHPINCVSWEQANAYCREAGSRLPTEAEWEYAARGPGAGEAPWGIGEIAGRVNACGAECNRWEKEAAMPPSSRAYDADDGWPGTAPVGSFPRGATPTGIQDLLGNVWEWTSDWFETYKAGDVMNPHGARAGDRKAIRGGGFNVGEASWLHPAFRFHQLASASAPAIGFRCARDL